MMNELNKYASPFRRGPGSTLRNSHWEEKARNATRVVTAGGANLCNDGMSIIASKSVQDENM